MCRITDETPNKASWLALQKEEGRSWDYLEQRCKDISDLAREVFDLDHGDECNSGFLVLQDILERGEKYPRANFGGRFLTL